MEIKASYSYTWFTEPKESTVSQNEYPELIKQLLLGLKKISTIILRKKQKTNQFRFKNYPTKKLALKAKAVVK